LRPLGSSAEEAQMRRIGIPTIVIIALIILAVLYFT
jgi:hypothetical protein